jgi:ribosomal protein L11 methyltransferase
MPWLQVSITAEREQAPLLELLLENLGAVSVTLGDAADHPILEPSPGEQPLWPQTRVSALFEGARNAKQLNAKLQASLPAEMARNLTLERVEDRIWERVWMEDFHPMRFGHRLWVCPQGMPPEAADAVTLELDPGLAFGTGTHPTTGLCLEWLDGADLRDLAVIDYGCGSGILAIAALLLGASGAIAVDHDPQALLATRENALRNRVEQRLSVCPPSQMPDTQAQVLLANILAYPLIELCTTLAERVAPDGRIVLSGILSEQAHAVTQAYHPYFDMHSPVTRDGWVRLEGVRRSPRPKPPG